jgi:fatty acid desaturase
MRERDMLVQTEGLRRNFDQGAWAITGQQPAGEWSWAKAVAWITAGLVLGALFVYLVAGSLPGYVGLGIAYVVFLFRAHQLQVDYRERERALSEPAPAPEAPARPARP